MSDVYVLCAVVGGAMLVLQTLLMVFGAGDHHDVGHGEGGLEGHDVGHVDQGIFDVKWLSLKTLVSYLTFFGLAGLAAEKAGLSTVLTLTIALASGAIAVVVVALLMSSLSRLQSRGNVVLANAVGRTGRVYLRIPESRRGAGKVTIEVQGRSVEVDAVTAGPEIPTGTTVRVLRLAGGDTLDVISVVG
jgi:membrane protein implicated in regulation of membrane protease activity